MEALFFPVLAGILITLQSVFNTNASSKIGIWETNLLVHAGGLILAVILVFTIGQGNFKKVGEVNIFYLMGGFMGVVVIFSVMKGITLLGATLSVAVLLITQLIAATVVDSLGLFGIEKTGISLSKCAGLLMMIAGVILYELKN